MAAYMLCITADGGLPLFYRNKGDLKPLPFPVIGSLNGVHMFCKSHNLDLQSTTTNDSKIIWKDYHNSLKLILVKEEDDCSDQQLSGLLDVIFQAMVLVYGQEDLTNIKNIERFKREIKVCFQLLDGILQYVQCPQSSPVTGCVDLIAGPENNVLQSYIDGFAEAAESPYGCLLVAGKVAVATKKWWELSAVELVLLSMFVTSLPRCSSRDVAVFLPTSSPTVPHRLLTFQLLLNVEVCVICGPTPSLEALQMEVDRYWRPCIDSLKSLSRLYPRNFPFGLQLDSSVLGFLLVNLSSHRCLCSVCPHTDDPARSYSGGGKQLSGQERREILLSFYKAVYSEIWTSIDNPEGTEKLQSGFLHQVSDTYLCTDRHKCYAFSSQSHTLLILFSTAIPTYAMRSVATKTLHILLRDKSVII